ncbi:uncharacterized protein LOC113208160 isoform X2 [Frankliniella occidentalis]|nr:uncharacterized protein LOC113208160 isoform X2 [Frankliniella occidentalis]
MYANSNQSEIEVEKKESSPSDSSVQKTPILQASTPNKSSSQPSQIGIRKPSFMSLHVESTSELESDVNDLMENTSVNPNSLRSHTSLTTAELLANVAKFGQSISQINTSQSIVQSNLKSSLSTGNVEKKVVFRDEKDELDTFEPGPEHNSFESITPLRSNSENRLAVTSSSPLISDHPVPQPRSSLVPNFTTAPGGIRNIGNTCFMASTLQALLHLRGFIAILKQHTEHSVLCMKSNCFACCIFHLLDILKTGETLDPSVTYLKFSKFLRGSESFFDGAQHDAHEFLCQVLQVMNNVAVGEEFGFYQRSDRRCTSCGEVSVSNYTLTTQIQLQMDSSVQAAINSLFAWSSMQVKVLCESCHKQCDFDRRFVLDSAPKTLVVQLLRFKADGSRDDASIEINQRIMFNNLQYELCGMVLHTGVTASAGHYTAKVAQTDSNNNNVAWFKCNDSLVSVDSMDLKSQTDNAAKAYILFYDWSSSSESDLDERKEDHNELIHHSTSVAIPLPKEASIEVFNQPVSGDGDNGNRLVIDVDRNSAEEIPLPKSKASKQPLKTETPMYLRKNFRGTPFNTQFVTAIYSLYQYFLSEKEFGGPLIDVCKVRERVSQALHISKRMVTDCKQKIDTAMASGIPFHTPKRTRNKQWKARNVDNFTKAAITNLIHQTALTGRLVTIKELLELIRQRSIAYHGGLSTLRKIVRNLGFKYARVNGRRVVCEKPSVVLKKIAFLRRYNELQDFDFDLIRGGINFDYSRCTRWLISNRYSSDICEYSQDIQNIHRYSSIFINIQGH